MLGWPKGDEIFNDGFGIDDDYDGDDDDHHDSNGREWSQVHNHWSWLFTAWQCLKLVRWWDYNLGKLLSYI